MKRHLTIASGERIAAGGRHLHTPQARAHGRPAGTLLWRHTLILEGRLDERSRFELEDEVECLYQEGVSSLRIDLRRLEEADEAGVESLASLGLDGRRRGQHIDVIPGAIGTALAQAGAQDLLVDEGVEPPLGGTMGPALRASMPSRSTTTVKGLA